MKNILAILLLFSLCSCKKALDIPDVNFDVTTSKSQINLGDTTRFSFTGNPDMITFWSGEVGKRYNYRNRIQADGTPILRFRSKRFHPQANTLYLLVSTDFAGVSSSGTAVTNTNIITANWTDITSRANLSPANGALTSSGSIDLSDFSNQSKPIYLAFKYRGLAGYPLNRWEIDSLVIRNNLPDGTSYIIGNFNSYNAPYTNYGVTTFNPGFVFYNISNSLVWFNSTVNSQAGIVIKTDAAGLTADAESWAILGPINLKKVTPDNGLVIKGFSQNLSDLNFTYKYPFTGTYNATFVGSKTNIDEQNYSTKQLTLSVK